MTTWEELVEAEPMLAVLERATRDIARQSEDDDDWCASRAWYRDLSPALSRVIGWGRELQPVRSPVSTDPPEVQTTDELLGTVEDDPRLRTEEALNTAWDHLYGLLPACRHEGNC